MPTLLTSGLVIEHLAFKVRNYRYLRRGLRNMALELKGLKGKAIKARANLDALNAAYDKFNEAAPAHLADVDGLATQIEGMQEDLEFAAQTMGNSVNGSATGATEKPKEQGGEKQVITAADVGTIAPPPAPAPMPADTSDVVLWSRTPPPELHTPTMSDRVSGSMVAPPRE